MANHAHSMKEGRLESEVRDLQLKEEGSDAEMDNIPMADASREHSDSPEEAKDETLVSTKRPSRSPVKSQNIAQSPMPKEELIGGDVTLKQEPGKPPKLSRSTSHKVEKRPPPLYTEYADATGEATKTFQVIHDCTYANKYLGSTDPALECDCAEEWGESPTSRAMCSNLDILTY